VPKPISAILQVSAPRLLGSIAAVAGSEVCFAKVPLSGYVESIIIRVRGVSRKPQKRMPENVVR
jgi:hypothetical protein